MWTQQPFCIEQRLFGFKYPTTRPAFLALLWAQVPAWELIKTFQFLSRKKSICTVSMVSSYHIIGCLQTFKILTPKHTLARWLSHTPRWTMMISLDLIYVTVDFNLCGQCMDRLNLVLFSIHNNKGAKLISEVYVQIYQKFLFMQVR